MAGPRASPGCRKKNFGGVQRDSCTHTQQRPHCAAACVRLVRPARSARTAAARVHACVAARPTQGAAASSNGLGPAGLLRLVRGNKLLILQGSVTGGRGWGLTPARAMPGSSPSLPSQACCTEPPGAASRPGTAPQIRVRRRGCDGARGLRATTARNRPSRARCGQSTARTREPRPAPRPAPPRRTGLLPHACANAGTQRTAHNSHSSRAAALTLAVCRALLQNPHALVGCDMLAFLQARRVARQPQASGAGLQAAVGSQ